MFLDPYRCCCFSGKFPLQQIRFLPQDHPHSNYDSSSVLPVGRRRTSTALETPPIMISPPNNRTRLSTSSYNKKYLSLTCQSPLPFTIYNIRYYKNAAVILAFTDQILCLHAFITPIIICLFLHFVYSLKSSPAGSKPKPKKPRRITTATTTAAAKFRKVEQSESNESGSSSGGDSDADTTGVSAVSCLILHFTFIFIRLLSKFKFRSCEILDVTLV